MVAANGHFDWPELDELRCQFLGDIFLPGSPGYDASVTVWHKNPLLEVHWCLQPASNFMRQY